MGSGRNIYVTRNSWYAQLMQQYC